MSLETFRAIQCHHDIQDHGQWGCPGEQGNSSHFRAVELGWWVTHIQRQILAHFWKFSKHWPFTTDSLKNIKDDVVPSHVISESQGFKKCLKTRKHLKAGVEGKQENGHCRCSESGEEVFGAECELGLERNYSQILRDKVRGISEKRNTQAKAWRLCETYVPTHPAGIVRTMQ